MEPAYARADCTQAFRAACAGLDTRKFTASTHKVIDGWIVPAHATVIYSRWLAGQRRLKGETAGHERLTLRLHPGIRFPPQPGLYRPHPRLAAAAQVAPEEARWRGKSALNSTFLGPTRCSLPPGDSWPGLPAADSPLKAAAEAAAPLRNLRRSIWVLYRFSFHHHRPAVFPFDAELREIPGLSAIVVALIEQVCRAIGVHEHAGMAGFRRVPGAGWSIWNQRLI